MHLDYGLPRVDYWRTPFRLHNRPFFTQGYLLAVYGGTIGDAARDMTRTASAVLSILALRAISKKSG